MHESIMHPNLLYLDDARIGRFRSQARDLHHAFLELVGESPCSPRVIELLKFGADAIREIRPELRKRLVGWKGVRDLKSALVDDLDCVQPRDVVLASRAKSLMQLGARMLFQNCRRCLTVDLNWPAYQNELENTAAKMGGDVVNVKIRKRMLVDSWDAEAISAHIAETYSKQRCDGIFVVSVDPWGNRLPIDRIVHRIAETNEIRFALVDAAQAIGQISLSELVEVADFVVAGAQKWVGGYFPLGIGIAANPNSQQWISRCIESVVNSISIDDGLLRFVESVESNRETKFPETVNLGPLFTTCGAWKATPSPQIALPTRIRNADQVALLAERVGWKSMRPHSELRTGCIILKSMTTRSHEASSDAIRNAFEELGIVLSAYPNGVVRMAMPDRPLKPDEIQRLETALERVSQTSMVSC